MKITLIQAEMGIGSLVRSEDAYGRKISIIMIA